MGSAVQTTVQLDVHIGEDDLRRSLCDDVRVGLSAAPKWLPPKWFYDDRGSKLFTQITQLAEYYPTRRERALLSAHAQEISQRTGARSLAELGSGTSEKTTTLLDALVPAGLERFVPFDVSVTTLENAAWEMADRYPGIEVHAVAGDFEQHLDRLPAPRGPQLVAFLGGTLGNLLPEQRARFLQSVAAMSATGDSLLLGVDLVKDSRRLVAAYDDSAGVTAEFNKNVLRVMNRCLDANFDLDSFSHRAVWDPANEWMEMRLRSDRDQEVSLPAMGMVVHFGADEEMRTEVSAKFRRAGLTQELTDAGFDTAAWWTDARQDYALALAVRH